MVSILCWKDISGLICWIGVDYNTSDWKMFIGSWQSSLKGVGLQNGNVFASMPGAHSAHIRETYEYYSVKLLLNSVNYRAPRWLVCVCVGTSE